MPYKTLDCQEKGHVFSITLIQSTLTVEMAQELDEVARVINGDNDVYVVMVTGTQGKFCAGGEKGVEAFHPAAAVAAIERPVIAIVNGEASGEGLELALACDIRIASEEANFSLPQIKEGRMPADGGTQRLPRIVGRGKALEMLMTGEPIDAKEALEIGLISQVFPTAALAAEGQKLAETVAAKGPLALRYLKEAINKGMDMTLEQGLRLEADLYFLLHTTADRTEGIKAFLEKRKPFYEGK